MSNESLTPTSYLVLGLLAQQGPCTPYDLKRHVAATVGNFWSFPHTQLYSEPARLARVGLVTEQREHSGRRRRVFAVTEAGRAALRDWLARPSTATAEHRDPGLLQLFFSEQAGPAERARLAAHQERVHRDQLAAYERIEADIAAFARAEPQAAHAQRWRAQTLRMGLRYERAAVAFWQDVASMQDGPPSG